jgi:FkbM family methyltransferase
MTFFDIGAHVGFMSLYAAAHTGARVWAFEAEPSNARLLAHNIEANQLGNQVVSLHAAVTDYTGTATVHRSERDSGSARVHWTGPPASAGSCVPAITIDGWAAAQGWPRVDMAKLDIEGSEPRALRGMEEVCRRNPDLQLIVELNDEALRAAGESAEGLLRTLANLGFDDIRRVDTGHRVTGERDLTALARRSRWVPLNLYCRRRS